MSQEKPGTSGEPESTPQEPETTPEAAKAAPRTKDATPADKPASSDEPTVPTESDSTAQPGFGAAEGYGLAGTQPENSASEGELAFEYAVKTTPRRREPALITQVGAELFGSFVMVLAGLGTLLYAANTGLGSLLNSYYTGVGMLGVALAFGLGAAVAHLTIGRISGGHLNPAISLGAAIAGRISPVQMVCYWVAQCVGAVAAAAVLYLPLTSFTSLESLTKAFFSATANGFDSNSPLSLILTQNYGTSGGFSEWAALLTEGILTAILVAVFLTVTNRSQREGNRLLSSALAYGATLTVAVMIATPITNAGLNPARSLASAIFSDSWAWNDLWVFLVGPLAGGVIAGIAALFVRYSGGADTDDLDEDEDFDVLEDSVIVEDESGHEIVLDERL